MSYLGNLMNTMTRADKSSLELEAIYIYLCDLFVSKKWYNFHL